MPSLVTLMVFPLDAPVPAAAPFSGVMVKPSLVILVLAPVPPFASLNSTLVRSFSSFFSE